MGQSCNPASKRSSKMAPVVVSPSGKHTATLIFLHGLGDTGHGWASTLAEVRQSHVKIVCPTANTIPVTLNSGMLKVTPEPQNHSRTPKSFQTHKSLYP